MSDSKSSVPEAPKIVLDLPGDKPDPEPDFSAALKRASDLMDARRFRDAVDLLEAELKRTAHRAADYGRKACGVFLQLGISRFELDEMTEAERAFTDGLELARRTRDLSMMGTQLHELSLVSLKRGDVAGATRYARESLVEKLKDVLDTAAKDRPGRIGVRRDPANAISHLAGIMSYDRRNFQDMRTLFEFALECYEALNDLAPLVQTLYQLAILARELEGDRASYAALARAVSISRIAGLGLVGTDGGGPLGQPVAATTRVAIETSLIAQFRAIATGLLIDRLRRGQDLSEDAWWQQYKSLRAPAPPLLIDSDNADFQAFQEEMRMAAVERAPRIAQADLMQQTVNVNGAEMPIWREGTINRQLAEMRSSLRLFVAGGDIVRAERMLASLGHPTAMPVTPDVFIFGEVAPMTTIGKAQLFDFTREYAVSPYIHADSEGMVDQGRVVVRRILIDPLDELTAPPGHHVGEYLKALDANNKAAGSTRAEGRRRFVYGHELCHVLQLFSVGQPAGFSSWRALMREDFCRFVATPRSFVELVRAFTVGFDIFPPLYYLPADSPAEMPFDKLIRQLRQDGLIEMTPDNQFRLVESSTG